ncbi:arylsulfatase A-like enzyme [Halarchaeum rubridurum]|uniref:Arylsulfatase A-like enzyme n=1 Tax=Halarchaeum rubridurum TaxID=489911 RepID=A0A830FZ16_9EURY|nr:sulfatase [Halarchaeum rubridurum]MBP1953342.1 arylsulfatase A-like enzyme [Halarchaeum rubridurum]GGM66063.1 hypothetical protein GCM10009017_15160 [Halarchaeum rubridurum]
MSNVLLVTVDSLRADHVGCYGYDRETTPNIDALAESASLYENAFAHACSTRPSFPAIFTSAYPLMYGGYERLSENRTLVSEVFDDAGYRTGGIHSNAYLNPEFGYDRGFDYFYDSMSETGPVERLRHWVKSRLDEDGFVYKSLASAFDTAERTVGANVGSAYIDADESTDRAVEFLRGGESHDEFLWVHYMDVHHPYLPPEEHQRAFRDDPISERRAIQLRRKFMEDPEGVTDDELDDIIDLYDASIRFTDEQVGRLLDAADEHWDDYTVAFTADHGEEFTDHGEFSHFAKFYDEVMHVPLVVDDGEHSGRRDEMVGLIDLAPTLVDAAELDRPEGWYGYPLSRLHRGDWPRDSVLGDWSPDGRSRRDIRYAYRDREWKFISRDAGEELYHLTEDPGEHENLVAEETAVAEELRDVITAHEEEIERTQEDLGDVEMEEEVKERLRDLGYAE